jgi:pyruvate dehydrogenase E1 component
LAAVIEKRGSPNAPHYLLEQLLEHARQNSIDLPFSANTGYVNTIEPEQEARCPGNIAIEKRLRAYMRWNAMAMVVRANRLNPADGGDLGGHIGVLLPLWPACWGAGFNHFWHAESENHGGRLPLHPGPQRARHLRPRLPGRALE